MTTTIQDGQRAETLNGYLKGEISAVETYQLALDQVGKDPAGALMENRDCHQRRVIMLRERVKEAGGVPSETSGAWGHFAKLVERGAAVIGLTAIYAALEEGEDHGLATYRERTLVDQRTMTLITDHLMPAQVRTHQRMQLLKQAV